MKQITFSKDALKTLSRMPANTSKLIRSKISQYAEDPTAQSNNVKALRGQTGVCRLRIGDWRILFSDDGRVIAIIRIAPRGAAYD